MKITKISNDFTPVHQGVFFEIETETEIPSDLVVEVVRIDDETIVATQQLRSVTKAMVNIAPYITRFTTLKPMDDMASSFAEAEVAKYAIRVDGVTSEQVAVSTNLRDTEMHSTATTMPTTRHMAYGEGDELFIMAGKGETIVAEISADNGELLSLEHTTLSGPVRLYLSTKDFVDDVTALNIRLLCNGTMFNQIYYTVTPLMNGGTRLAWISDCGSIERYTFPVSRKISRIVDKQNFNTSEGRFTANLCTQSKNSLISRYEPRRTIEALAQIISSPKVWFCRNGLFKEVEVHTSNIEYGLFKEPSLIALDFCEWQKEVAL